MYPDIITPKSFPHRLQESDYDPFGLMPGTFPQHPRVLLSGEQLEATRRRLRTCAWAEAGLALLVERSRSVDELPDPLPAEADPKINTLAVTSAERNALAALLTGEARRRDAALSAFRRLALASRDWPLVNGDARAAGGGLNESRIILGMGRTYDLLAAGGLSAEDDALFRAMLEATRPVSDACTHFLCGNHNTWSLAARLSVSSALGDRQGIHDALYGCERDGRWRYGLIHQLRHDFLSDGLHWEGAPGYHFYTLMAMTEAACVMQHLGVDLWHAELPPQQQTDGHDLHRAYGPIRGTKCLKAAFDAPLFQAFPNGDLCLLHDSGLANLRGLHVWGILYNKAFEAYGDEAYAWLLGLMEREHPRDSRKHPDLPMPLNTNTGDLDFARLRDEAYPEGRLSLRGGRTFALTARHEHGCTLFPAQGSAVLRSGAAPDAVAASLNWGAHCAGHMSPASLHLDISARGRRITDAPRSGGYDDPLHLTWVRTTIAHNTVCVDGTPMFPYDFDTDGIWECDSWRDRVSDGEPVLFQPDGRCKAVRAVNENVYPGVRLDRTAVVMGSFLLDVYRVLSSEEHDYDWAMHVIGAGSVDPGSGTAAATAEDLGSRRGYSHFTDARGIVGGGQTTFLSWKSAQGITRACIAAPAGSRIVLARDPQVDSEEEHALGETGPTEQRTAVIVRARTRSALFASLWTFDGGADPDVLEIEGTAETDVTATVEAGDRRLRIRLPFAANRVRTD